MSNHPYPEHAVEAVAEAMGRSRTGEEWSRFQDYFIEHAHVALSALWDASRVDTAEQVDELPNDAVLIDGNRVVADDYVTHCIIDLPAHVLHWGDSDE